MDRTASRNPGRGRSLVVLKLGTRILTTPEGGLNRKLLNQWLRQILELREGGWNCVLVTSGAIGLGRSCLQLEGDLSTLDKQSCAAIGQCELMTHYSQILEKLGKKLFGKAVPAAQILVTAEDLRGRKQLASFSAVLADLLEKKVIPIVNENDVLSSAEIVGNYEKRLFGDNDQLSSLIATKLGADMLMILTDVDGIYSGNPKVNAKAAPIPFLSRSKELRTIDSGSGKSSLGRGGMVTKLSAADRAARAGVATLICSGFVPRVITKGIGRFSSWKRTGIDACYPGTLICYRKKGLKNV